MAAVARVAAVRLACHVPGTSFRFLAPDLRFAEAAPGFSACLSHNLACGKYTPYGYIAFQIGVWAGAQWEPRDRERCIRCVKLGRLWKVAAAAAALFVIGGLGAYAWVVQTRPPELGLAGQVNHS